MHVSDTFLVRWDSWVKVRQFISHKFFIFISFWTIPSTFLCTCGPFAGVGQGFARVMGS